MLSKLCFSLVAAGLGCMPLLRAAPGVADAATRISNPTVHENIAVYFVHGASAPGPVPLTLQEALNKGDVDVIETGNVRELEIENRGSEPVFVQFGDLVKGGRQDRVLTVSLLLPPKSGKVPIGSYCVEQGRWSARGTEDAAKFSHSDMLMPSREAKVAMARPATKPSRPVDAGSMTEPRARAGRETANVDPRTIQQRRDAASDGQSEVWRNVGAMQMALSANLAAPVASEQSRTSLQLALENEKLQSVVGDYLGKLEPAGLAGDDIVGVVIAVNGRVSSADVYPSNGLFQKMWPKLVRAGVTEALAHKAAGEAAATPASKEIEAFLADAEKGAQSEQKFGTLATLDTRDAEKALRVEVRSASGVFVHRNYLAK